MAQYKLNLSLSGGGVRGIIAASLLKEFEDDLREGSLDGLVCTYAGTSIGSLLCAALLDGYSANDIVSKLFSFDALQNIFKNYSWFGRFPNYVNLGLFFPRYDGRNKRMLIEQSIRANMIRDWDKPFFVPLYDINYGDCRVIHKDVYKIKCAELLDAATAAPVLFPPVNIALRDTVENRDVSGWFVDGAIGINDPSGVQLASMIARQVKLQDMGTIHIGYKPTYKTFSKKWFASWGAVQWALAGDIISRIMYTPDQAAQYACSAVMGSKFVNIVGDTVAQLDDFSADTYSMLMRQGRDLYEVYKPKIMTMLQPIDGVSINSGEVFYKLPLATDPNCESAIRHIH